jgi:hypothetical protein
VSITLAGSPVLTERVDAVLEDPGVAADRVDNDPSPSITTSPDSIPTTLSETTDNPSGPGSGCSVSIMPIGSPVLAERVVEVLEALGVAGRADGDPSPSISMSPDSMPVALSGGTGSRSGSGWPLGVDHG